MYLHHFGECEETFKVQMNVTNFYTIVTFKCLSFSNISCYYPADKNPPLYLTIIFLLGYHIEGFSLFKKVL